MANPPSFDMASFAAAAGVGIPGSNSGWAIFVSSEPESPNTTITFFDTGGSAPNPRFLLDNPSVQIRIRGNVDGYSEAFAKAQELKDLFLGLPSQDINGTRYVAITMASDVIPLGLDDSGRPKMVLNFDMFREPSTGGNRISL